MNKKKETVRKIKALIKDYFNNYEESNTDFRVPLMSRLYDENEISEVVDTLLTPERLTLNASGKLKIEAFEDMWSNFIGTRNGIMVNSGSSANLVAFYILSICNIKTVKNP